MEYFVIQVDGLEVAICQSEALARSHALLLASDDPSAEVRVLRIRDAVSAWVTPPRSLSSGGHCGARSLRENQERAR